MNRSFQFRPELSVGVCVYMATNLSRKPCGGYYFISRELVNFSPVSFAKLTFPDLLLSNSNLSSSI